MDEEKKLVEQKDVKKERRPLTPRNVKKVFSDAFSLAGDTADFSEINDRFVSGGVVTGTNLSILLLAALIASIGLNMNSTAVIIGAMLVSPLMGTIMAMGYGLATAQLQLVRNGFIGFLFQIIVALAAATIYFLLSPISAASSELLARTQPTVWDVLIALAGGCAGAIGLTRRDKTSNVIPGVAIATALMPPLCTAGYGLATGQFRYTLGAFYLFAINSFFIMMATLLILVILRVPVRNKVNKKTVKKLRIRIVVMTLLLLIPSIFFGYRIAVQSNTAEPEYMDTVSTFGVKTVTKSLQEIIPAVTNVSFTISSEYNGETDTVDRALLINVKSAEPLTAHQQGLIDSAMKAEYKNCTVSFE